MGPDFGVRTSEFILAVAGVPGDFAPRPYLLAICAFVGLDLAIDSRPFPSPSKGGVDLLILSVKPV